MSFPSARGFWLKFSKFLQTSKDAPAFARFPAGRNYCEKMRRIRTCVRRNLPVRAFGHGILQLFIISDHP